MVKPSLLERENELPPIPLVWLVEVNIKKGWPSEGSSNQGTSYTSTKVPSKEIRLGKEAFLLGLNKDPNTQKDTPTIEGPKAQ